MTTVICLQGGHEFTSDCEGMDREVLDVSGADDVFVLAGAARVGSDHDGAVGRARRHYESLGATVTAVPDPRTDHDGAVSVLADASGLLVFPGGSPSSLLSVLSGDIRRLVLERHRAGLSISGASAGAMVLCSRMVRPDRGDVVEALGLLDGVALPHWSPGSDRDWSLPHGVDRWGLPECGGVLVEPAATGRDTGDEPTIRAVGRGEPSRFTDDAWAPVPR